MKEIWLESQATVLDCQKQSPLLSTLTLGLRPKKKFRVAYNFTIDGQLHSGTFPSAKPYAEGDLIPLRYSAVNPDQNNLNYQNQATPTKTPIIPLVLALLFLLALIRFYITHTSH